jgi:hypothetical protein
MLGKIKTALWQIITEPNNHTVCPVRLMSIAGCLQFLTLAGWHVHHNGTFNPQDYALCFGTIIGAVGVALGLKKDSPNDSTKP